MIYFLPVVTSTIATALIWNWLYQPSLGLFNQIFAITGVAYPAFPAVAGPSPPLHRGLCDVGKM